MKVPVYDVKGHSKGEVTLGKAFSKRLRPDMIKKAVLAEESRNRQPYGSDKLAGQRTSAYYKGRRGIRNSMMNREISRMKRIIGPGFMHFRARAIPGVVKGRKAHPPKTEKNWEKKINSKERMQALLSAVSSTVHRDIVSGRGHMVKDAKHVPLVVEDKLCEISKNKDVVELLVSLGLGKELERCAEKKTRSGRGKTRGRKTVKRKGPMIVVSETKGIEKAARNIPGVEVSTAKDLRVSMLAPGTVPGRLCIWTKSAVQEMEKLAAS